MKIRKLLILNFKEQINGLFHQEAGQKNNIIILKQFMLWAKNIKTLFFLQITGLTNKMPRLSCKRVQNNFSDPKY